MSLLYPSAFLPPVCFGRAWTVMPRDSGWHNTRPPSHPMVSSNSSSLLFPAVTHPKKLVKWRRKTGRGLFTWQKHISYHTSAQLWSAKRLLIWRHCVLLVYLIILLGRYNWDASEWFCVHQPQLCCPLTWALSIFILYCVFLEPQRAPPSVVWGYAQHLVMVNSDASLAL